MTENQTVAQDSVVSINYVLTDDEGAVIDTSEGAEPLTYLHGHGQIITGLESELEGRAVGDEASIRVEAGDGYGDHDPEKTVQVPRDRFEFEVTVGDFVQAQQQDGTTFPFQVVAVEPDQITLDGNHPLAGKALNFQVTVVAVRAASAEELEHGHSH